MFARFLLIALTALTTGAAHAVTFVPLAGEITVTTSPDRREASVAVANMGMVTALFCIAFAEPLDQPIRLEEKGQIIFLPQPIETLPLGGKLEGVEPIAQTLTVIPVRGPSFAFVAQGVKPIYDATHVFVIRKVTKEDAAEGCGASRT